MGLTKKEVDKIRDELDNSQRPIFLFDDDADGLCSFLLLYKYKKEGKGVLVKTRPLIDDNFVNSVINYEADKVFILDIAQMDEEFPKKVKRPIIWIDHHGLSDIEGVHYFNPRKHDPHIVCPTTKMCYAVTRENIWLAMIGCIADWHVPEFKDEFCRKYPGLINPEITDPGEAMFESKVGKLVQIFNFVLKGQTSDALKYVKTLSRIEDPNELLEESTSAGKFVMSKYKKVYDSYKELKMDLEKNAKEDKLFLIYKYPDNKMSFTGELSNEILHKKPNKVIIIAREKDGEMRMSLRSGKYNISEPLAKALQGLDGYGGGHEKACGACVKKEDFEEFLNKLRNNIQ